MDSTGDYVVIGLYIGMMGLFCLGGIVMTVSLLIDARRPDREEQKPWEGRSPWL